MRLQALNKAMKMTHKFFSASLLATLIVLQASCNTAGTSVAGIEGTGSPVAVSTVSKGPITSFGSIFVNGIRFDTSKANITIDQTEAAEDALKLGMIVTVDGTLNADGKTGIATSVNYEENIEGPILGIQTFSGSQKQLNVMGIPVIVGNDIAFEALDFETLLEGQFIEVSGYQNINGEILATRIEKLADAYVPGEPVEIISFISELDTENKGFKFQALDIDYSGAEFVDLNEENLKNDLTIEVGGTLDDQGVLIADWIFFDDFEKDFEPGDKVFIEGVINKFESLSFFEVDGIEVDGSQLVLEDDILALLRQGAVVEVNGLFSEDDTLIAEEIDIIEAVEVYALAQVQDLLEDNEGIVLLNQALFVFEDTNFEDESEMEDRFINIESLMPDDWVEVWLFNYDDNWVIDTLKRRDSGDTTYLEGIITEVFDSGFGIQSFDVDSSQLPPEQLEFIEVNQFVSFSVEITDDGLIAIDIVEHE